MFETKFVVGTKNQLVLRDISGSLLTRYTHEKPVNCCAISRDIIVSGSDKLLRVWKMSAEKCIASMEHKKAITCCAISSTDKFFVSGARDGIKVWDTTGNCKQSLLFT